MISFKGFNYPKEIVMQAVRWHLAYRQSTSDLEKMLAERSSKVDRSTLNRWVL